MRASLQLSGAPTSTPKRVISKLNGEVRKILNVPESRERLSGHGLIPGGGTPEDLGRFLQAEIAKWSKLIKATGIRAE